MTEDPGSRLVSLGHDRVLHAWEGGAPDGVPVLFHHGMPSGRLQAVLGAESARRLGVRLVSYNRPGYGRSTATPPSLASAGPDTLRVADALGIDSFAVLGASAGGPYALATGLAGPDRVRAVGVAAGIGPWRLIEPPGGDDPDGPLLALADAGDVTAALQGFRAQGSAAYDAMLGLEDEAMVAEFFADAPDSETRWLDETARRRWAADMRDALQTYDGFARDNVAWGGRWDIDPADLRVPTWLWYGESDRIVAPSHGHWLARRIPDARLVVRPGHGHAATIFDHWDEMLTTLRDQV